MWRQTVRSKKVRKYGESEKRRARGSDLSTSDPPVLLRAGAETSRKALRIYVTTRTTSRTRLPTPDRMSRSSHVEF